jgi:nucleotide-binding universal stress UspA family protein
MTVYPVVVGADGTATSKAAVRWAAREAQRRGVPLRIVHVFDWDWHKARYETGNDYAELVRRSAEGLTDNAVYEARSAAPDVRVEGSPRIGHAAAQLLAESGQADLIVLGSRGHGGFGGLLLGSVSQRVAMHARCPVVVVRGRGDVADGPVIVGVDDSPSADLVLETAFAAAAARGCRLELVRAYLPAVPPGVAYELLADVDLPEVTAAEEDRMAEQVAPWRAKYPGVPVRVLLTREGAARILVQASKRAQLIVVGSRGRGVIAGTLLGSTGLQLLHHADCPVHLVRPVDSAR